MFTFTLASAARRLAVTLALFATRYASRLRRPSYRAVPKSYDAQVPAHTLPNRGPLRMVGHKRERLRDCFCTQKHLVDFEDLCPRSMLGFYRREKVDLGHDP